MSRDEDVFAEVLGIPAAGRPAYLDRACEGDPALRARIEELLTGYGEAERAMPRAIVTGIPAPPGEAPSGRIGRYKLLEKIGEGGCGVVWMAEQEEPVRRRVALKEIKLGMDTKSVIARFEAERQALAMMDHPNIARVLDAGATAGGRPYFVMELVRGVPITDYCDKHRLPPKARLELFIAVCAAIQHAHQKGIIHRDIKPSNILVTDNDGAVVPKVIDFGIAKATQGRLTDQTLFTAFEQFIGTPVYMSPEQAEMSSAEIDPRSDVYSLGVLLYELLTGQPPFDAKSFAQTGVDEIRRQIRDVEPPKPSTRWRTLTDAERSTAANRRGMAPATLSVLLRGDLDWIVMRCLEKDRARRYASASALAADLQRYLQHEPVIARPPSPAYVLGKFARRHRLGLAATAAVLGALALGAAVSLWQARRSARAGEPAGAQPSEARQLVAKARGLFFQLDETRDDLRLAEEFLKEAAVKDAGDVEVWAAYAQLDEHLIERGWDLSDERREGARVATQRALRLDPKSFEARFAQIGLPSGSPAEMNERETEIRDLLRERPDEQRVLRRLGQLLRESPSRHDEANQIFDRSAALPGGDPLALYDKALNLYFDGRITEAEAALSAAIAQRPFIGAQLMEIKFAVSSRGDLDRAKALVDRIPPERLLEDRGCYFAYMVHSYRGAPESALDAVRAASRDWMEDASFFRGPRALLAGDALAQAGRADAAAVEWHAALKVVDTRLASRPNDFTALVNRLILLAKLGDTDGARRLVLAVRQIVRIDAPDLLVTTPYTWACVVLGDRAGAMRQIAAALADRRHAIYFTAADLRYDPRWAPLRSEPGFARLLAEAARVERADDAAAAPAQAPTPAVALADRARVLYDKVGFERDDLMLAEDFAKRATDADPTVAYGWGARAHVQAAFLFRGFAVGDEAAQRARDAESFAKRALSLQADEAEALIALGRVATYRRAYAQAEEILVRATAAHPDDGRIRRALTNALRGQPRRLPEALTMAQETVRLAPEDALAHYDLGSVYRDTYDFPAALRECDAAVALQPFGTALLAKAGMELIYRGDLSAMRATLDRLSPADQTEDRAVFFSMWCGLLERRPERVAAAAALSSRDYFEDNFYSGPKAMFLALACHIAGQENSARMQWQAAEQVMRDRLRGDAQNPAYHLQLASTLAWMGRTEEAAREGDPVEAGWREQLGPVEARQLARYYGGTGDPAKVVFYLRRTFNTTPFFTLPALRLDPYWDKLRGKPDFDAFLANPPPMPVPIAPAPYRGITPAPVTPAVRQG